MNISDLGKYGGDTNLRPSRREKISAPKKTIWDPKSTFEIGWDNKKPSPATVPVRHLQAILMYDALSDCLI
jgi:hypothetical protein